MRRLMLSLCILTAGSFLFCPACNKGGDNDNGEERFCSQEGLVIGPDYRLCACCGGWLIEIEGDTLVAWSIPEEFARELESESFPLPVYLEWKDYFTPCRVLNVECIGRR